MGDFDGPQFFADQREGEIMILGETKIWFCPIFSESIERISFKAGKGGTMHFLSEGLTVMRREFV